MVAPKSFINCINFIRSVTDPLAAFSRASPMKVTMRWDVGSSKQYLIMYGPARLFYAKMPEKTLWRMSLSDLISAGEEERGNRGERDRCVWEEVEERMEKAVASRRAAAVMIIYVCIEIINLRAHLIDHADNQNNINITPIDCYLIVHLYQFGLTIGIYYIKLKMILSSKQCLIISSQENREFFLFDPKTTAVLHKYRDDCFLSVLAYYPRSQQILGQQINKTFLNAWSYDSQETEIRVSLTETLTSIRVSSDSHYMMGGGATGNLYFWELPSGLLIRKKAVHSAEVRHVLEYQGHHLITASRSEVKLWPLSSLFIDTDHSSALKTYSSVLQIQAVAESRNILAVLTRKSLSFLQLSLTTDSKEFLLLRKIDYQYATALCLSRTSAFVGDGKGAVEVVELILEEEVAFRVKEGTQEIEIAKPKKKRTLAGHSKHPITALAFVESLGYLIAGHTSGEVVIWNNYEIKKSLHLFKTAISHLLVVPKPKELKVHQATKLQPLNKYELAKEQEPLDILPDYSTEAEVGVTASRMFADEKQQQQGEEQVLWNMVEVLNQPEKLLREQVQRLKGERKALMESNLHYFKLISQ